MTVLWVMLAASISFIFGRSVIIWSFLAYTMGPWALLFILLGPKDGVWERRLSYVQKVNAELQEMNKPKGYKDFDNVDDLFKQLESK